MRPIWVPVVGARLPAVTFGELVLCSVAGYTFAPNRDLLFFRDPEQEYYREKHKNRMLVVLAAIMASLVLANIGYVW